MRLSHLETPCLILDKDKLDTNLATMREHLHQLGVALRPHAKTAKSIDVLNRALDGRSSGITVSTLKEAEYFFEHGINDLLYAVGIAPVKLDRVAHLIRNGARVTVICDTMDQARAISTRARALGVTIPVLIEIDCDGHRSGVTVDDPLLLELGRTFSVSEGAMFRGILTHAGESYTAISTQVIRDLARQERDVAVACAQRLCDAGLACPVVSVGSTPTARFAEDLSGVTEVRAGVYMFYDLFMAGLGVCQVSDIALSVLTSVIGFEKHKGWIITDAGWMALSRDHGTAGQSVDQGYGLVCDVNGVPIPDLIVKATNQEHGIVAQRDGNSIDFDRFPVGTPLRILPNHACATAAMHDRYHVVEENVEASAVWHRINGW